MFLKPGQVQGFSKCHANKVRNLKKLSIILLISGYVYRFSNQIRHNLYEPGCIKKNHGSIRFPPYFRHDSQLQAILIVMSAGRGMPLLKSSSLTPTHPPPYSLNAPSHLLCHKAMLLSSSLKHPLCPFWVVQNILEMLKSFTPE